MKAKSMFLRLISVSVFTLIAPMSHATFMTYDDRTTFESTLGTIITDDYSNALYQNGDKNNNLNVSVFSDSAMSAVIGETEYTTTGTPNYNLIINKTTDPKYCAGCAGSFLLQFTTTSVGNASGVFGVGFDITSNSQSFPYDAFVTFGDDSTMNIDLGAGARFFGITADIGVKSIHLGLTDGGTTTSGGFAMDNLTIGSVPEPTILALLSLGFAGLGLTRYRART